MALFLISLFSLKLGREGSMHIYSGLLFNHKDGFSTLLILLPAQLHHHPTSLGQAAWMSWCCESIHIYSSLLFNHRDGFLLSPPLHPPSCSAI